MNTSLLIFIPHPHNLLNIPMENEAHEHADANLLEQHHGNLSNIHCFLAIRQQAPHA
jgi:hypothetical protein